jgi:uncharacterized protein with NRDE domain
VCVLALAIGSHPDWPLVLAGNRDELHARPAAPLARWAEAPEVLGGRDLEGGGTWLGVSEEGRLAVVTNLRGFGPPHPGAPSRGLLARDFLVGEGPYARFGAGDLGAFNPMNLIVVEGGRARFCSNRPASTIRELKDGLYGLSNGDLDEPWPKTSRLKAALADWLGAGAQDPESLFAALADETRPTDAELPSTGLDLERERLVSPIFIRNTPYGTRCSTIVRIASDGGGEILERRFGVEGEVSGVTALNFTWPPA